MTWSIRVTISRRRKFPSREKKESTAETQSMQNAYLICIYTGCVVTYARTLKMDS